LHAGDRRGRAVRFPERPGVPGAPLDAALRIEWVYRLVLEPGRLWRRYVVGNPLFPSQMMRQKVTSRAALDDEHAFRAQ
jgi:hypothetical protein